MNPDRWEQIRRLYHAAREVEPGQRDEFLQGACAGDEALLVEVRSLLAQEGKSQGLFETPAMEIVAKELAEREAQKPKHDLIGQTHSHYRIEKKIGEGGMGEVFLAHDTSLNRKVALKFLPPSMQQDPEAHKRFLREARSAAALDHPCICGIHEVGEFEGKEYIVMEYVDGRTLMDKLRRGRLPVNQALQIGIEVAEALQVAHSKGIVHRDLKPSNIMLTKTGHAKVMDFGLAKQVALAADGESSEQSVSLTHTGVTLGTLAYMSPEQVRGGVVDARSDIFSFGVVCTRC
jgi:serine/threonine protein kinase